MLVACRTHERVGAFEAVVATTVNRVTVAIAIGTSFDAVVTEAEDLIAVLWAFLAIKLSHQNTNPLM